MDWFTIFWQLLRLFLWWEAQVHQRPLKHLWNCPTRKHLCPIVTPLSSSEFQKTGKAGHYSICRWVYLFVCFLELQPEEARTRSSCCICCGWLSFFCSGIRRVSPSPCFLLERIRTSSFCMPSYNIVPMVSSSSKFKNLPQVLEEDHIWLWLWDSLSMIINAIVTAPKTLILMKVFKLYYEYQLL